MCAEECVRTNADVITKPQGLVYLGEFQSLESLLVAEIVT